jgi:hypothetical protein
MVLIPPCGVLELFSFNIFPQLRNFKTQGNTLFTIHTAVCILQLQKVLQAVAVLLQMDNPGVFFEISGNINIYPARPDFWIDGSDLFAQLVCIKHRHHLLASRLENCVLENDKTAF